VLLFFLFLTNSDIQTKNNSKQTSARVFYQKDSFIKDVSNENIYKTDYKISLNSNNPYISKSLGYAGYDSLVPTSFTNFNKNNKSISNTGIKYVYTNSQEDLNNTNYKLIEKVNSKIKTFSGQTTYKDIYLLEVNNPLKTYFSPKILDLCNKESCTSENDSKIKVRYNGKEKLENQSDKYELKIVDSNSNGVNLKITSDSRRFIASRENMQKGWELKINGKPENLFYVDEGFRGFFVEKGESNIEMTYKPPFLKESVILSLISLLILIILKYVVKYF
jgi:uncharacterized membrane protein YfhO